MIVHLIRGIVAACNLGSELSASDYRGDFQTLATLKDVFHPVGRESQISLLVGGTYDGPLAAEIEGRIVVLGDFLIGDNGVSSLGTLFPAMLPAWEASLSHWYESSPARPPLTHFVTLSPGWAGGGSGIHPHTGVFMQVGGDIQGGRTDGSTQAMMGGTVQHGGDCLSATTDAPFTATRCGSWETSGSGTFEKVALDPKPWMDMLVELQDKSAYWSSLTPNGLVNIESIHVDPPFNQVTLENGDDDCVQVFFFPQVALSTPAELIISPRLAGKTILINVELDSQGNVVIDNFINSIDTEGTSGNYFTSATKAAMLWNFGRASTVTLGASDGGTVFPGSILIPHGDLRMLLPGQDGRAIVFGDVYHNAWGSEFHNYEFDPPCALCRRNLPNSTFVPRTTLAPGSPTRSPSSSPSTKPSISAAPSAQPSSSSDEPTATRSQPSNPPFVSRSSCPSTFRDLGPELSASDYTGTFPRLVDAIDVMNPKGRESQVSLLVGGTYDGPLAAEIEGRIVVLGDFWIGENGVSSLGTYVPDTLRDPVEFLSSC